MTQGQEARVIARGGNKSESVEAQLNAAEGVVELTCPIGF